MLIGPLNVWRDGKPLGNSYIRRDLGIWGALTGMLHFFLANMLSMNYEYLGAFVENAGAPPSAAVRHQFYTWGTIFGYVVALLFIILMLLCSDFVLRKLGMKWWKRIQRSAYLVFLLTVAHAFLFQALESRLLVWIVVVAAIMAAVVGFQIYAFRKVRTSE